MSSKEAMASKALARLGEPSISAFDEDTDTAEKVATLYEDTILSLLSMYDWRWAMSKVELVIDGSAEPVNKWSRGFLLPDLGTDRVGPPFAVYNSVQVGSPKIFAYEIQGRWIMTNESVIVIEYIKRKDEGLWPGYFRRLAIEALAGVLALPVTENQTKDQYHNGLAFGTPSEGGRGGLFKMAVEADTVGNPTRTLLDDHDIMGSVRFGGYF